MAITFRHLIEKFIYLVQQVQPPLGILHLGDPGVDAAGDLVDVISNVVDLRAQSFDFLGWAGLDWLALDEPHQKDPLAQATLFGLLTQQFILLRCQFHVEMVSLFRNDFTLLSFGMQKAAAPAAAFTIFLSYHRATIPVLMGKAGSF